jgi:aspartyl/glutamyl-tRNA(Asn/Gln) amidotransferase C subunit
LDTDGVKPMEQVSSNQNIFRDDKCEHSLEQQEVLKNASVNEKGYFKVPRVMEGN